MGPASKDRNREAVAAHNAATAPPSSNRMTWPRGDVGSDTGVMSDALLRMEYSQDELGGKPSHHGLFSRFGKCVPTDVDFSLFAKRDGGTGLKYAGCLVDRLRC